MNVGKFGLFDYKRKLTPEEEDKALAIHQDSIIIDMLFQGPLSPYSLDEAFCKKIEDSYAPLLQTDPPKYYEQISNALLPYALRGELPEFQDCWYDSGITAGCRQLEVSGHPDIIHSMAAAQVQFDTFDWLIKATKAEHIRQAKRENKKAGFILSQDTVGVGKDLRMLSSLYDFGLRVMQLSYNTQTHVAAGCYERTDAGVTNFGVSFIEKMNELGMLVDTGHCGRQTTLDACALSKTPVIASHTCVKSLYPHTRAKDDDALRAIAESGGVVGIVAMPNFINADSHSATMEHVMDQIDYAVNLCGVDHVGIGTDWPMSEVLASLVYLRDVVSLTLGFKPGDGPGEETVLGLTEYRQFINYTRGLLSRGYDEQSIRKILGGNWLRVFEEVCG